MEKYHQAKTRPAPARPSGACLESHTVGHHEGAVDVWRTMEGGPYLCVMYPLPCSAGRSYEIWFLLRTLVSASLQRTLIMLRGNILITDDTLPLH